MISVPRSDDCPINIHVVPKNREPKINPRNRLKFGPAFGGRARNLRESIFSGTFPRSLAFTPDIRAMEKSLFALVSRRFPILLACIAFFVAVVTGSSPERASAFAGETTVVDTVSFNAWLEELKAEALKKGISKATLNAALANVEPVPRVVELDRTQPEFSQTFWKYLTTRVSQDRIERGRTLLKKHADILSRVESRFGVQPRFLVAFWGMESNFGDYTGVFPMIGALATLAHDSRRSGFFREQLLAALELIERNHLAADVKASWAGAMGQTQFIPTTYRDFALDFDNDGRRDLWGSLADVFASSANYLRKSGWDGARTWGREVKIPERFDLDLAGLGVEKPLTEWREIGVRRIDGRNLPRADVSASLILPAGYNGPAFLVYRNFRAAMTWNRSILYAIAVCHLADRLAGRPELRSPRQTEIPLSRRDIVFMQRRLTGLGFDTGGADGIAGFNTRKAIKAFQKSGDLPADGHPSFGLLERLRGMR